MLPLPKSGTINKIIHIADIHIHIGDIEETSRYKEYSAVFHNLFEYIKTIDNVDSAITIIAGDIFHSKNKLDASSISLFYKLIIKISLLTPVYIFYGNHDFKEELPESTNIIRELVNIMPNNIGYLHESGIYTVGNILFGYKSVKDKRLSGFPNIPDTVNMADIKYKIALYHGIVNSKINMFNGYDIGIFGDIHNRQIHNINSDNTWDESKFVYGYSGSLIQQDYGESPINHGGLLWDLDKRKVNTFNINTPVMRIYLYVCNNEYKVEIGNNQYMDLDIIKSMSEIQHIRVKESGGLSKTEITSKIGVDYCNDELLTNNKFNFDEVNSTEMWIKFIEQDCTNIGYNNWRDWINSVETLSLGMNNNDPRIILAIEKYNNYVKNCAVKKYGNIKFEFIKWSWLYCYGDNNWINFAENKQSIITINGKNDYGKSSFMDIICLALFNKSIPSRETDSYTKTIINVSKPDNQSAETKLIFTLNNNARYMLVRKFGIKTGETTKRSLTNELYLYNTETLTYDLVRDTISTIDAFISLYIGNIDDFLTISMMTQNIDNEIFTMRSSEQVEFIDKIINIDKLYKFRDLLHECSLAYKSAYEFTNTMINCTSEYTLMIKFDEHKYNSTNETINRLMDVRKSILDELSTFNHEWDKYTLAELNSDIDVDNINMDLCKQSDNIDNQIKSINEKIYYHSKIISSESSLLIFPHIKHAHYINMREKHISDKDIYLKYKDELSILLKNSDMFKQKERIKSQIDKIKSYNHPFNKDCDACKKQLWAIELDDLMKQYDELANYCEVDKNKIRAYMEFIDEYENFEKKLISINAYINSCEIINANKKELSEYELIKAKLLEIQQTKRIYDLHKCIIIYKRDKQLRSELDKVNCDIRIYEAQLNSLNEARNYVENNNALNEQRKQIANDIKLKHESLVGIINRLELYKEFIYRNMILPIIINNTNNIVKNTLNNDDYVLKVSITSSKIVSMTKSREMSLNWFIHNGTSMIPIKSCGGFRKFLYGLTLRIVICSLSGSSIGSKQIFIDEGFVSADINNLSKVPLFIKSLLNIYDNIVMVSHLDIIKDIANININITRDNNTKLSKILYGDNILMNANTSIVKAFTNTVTNCDKAICQALTKKGERCTKSAKAGYNYCGQHMK